MKSNFLPHTSIFSWIYLGGLFLIIALPLLNLPPWFSPPDWGKAVVFRIIFLTLLLVLLFHTLFQSKTTGFFSSLKTTIKQPIKEVLPFWLLLGFLGMNFLATVFSQDPWFSLWGDPQRGGGFVNFALYIIFALFTFSFLQVSRWKLVWNFALGIGFLVSLVAIFQQFSIFSNIFVPLKTQVSSTLGGPWLLGIYLILLAFIALSYGIQEKVQLRKFVYFFLFLLFGYIILLTVSQAAYVGFTVGLLYFLFFYPRKSPTLKTLTILGLAIATLALFYLSTHPEHSLSQNYIIQNLTEWRVDQSRLSTWKVSLQALQDRPFLGYGPENFSIGFDAYYDPTLPNINKQPPFGTVTTWWDRAHNIFFDTAVTTGIFAALIYLLFFATLLWKLQQLKRKKPEYSLIAHGIQAALLGYLAADFFSFDGFSTYITLFLVVGLSFSLLYRNNSETILEEDLTEKPKDDSLLFKLPLSIAIGLFFLLFIWIFHIQLFQINTQLNIAEFLVDQQECSQVIEAMDEIQQTKNPLLDSYANIQLVDYIRKCQQQLPHRKTELAQKGIELLKEHVELRPTYTRSWIFLGGFTNMLLEAETNAESKNLDQITVLKDEAHSYFGKAAQLSPGHQEIYTEWAKTFLIVKDYEGAKLKATECLALHEEIGECWWIVARAEISLGNIEEGNDALKIAALWGYPPKPPQNPQILYVTALLQLINAHLESLNYSGVAEVYEELIAIQPEPQYYASLAVAYKENGEFEKARETALKVLELDPTLRGQVELFIKSLP